MDINNERIKIPENVNFFVSNNGEIYREVNDGTLQKPDIKRIVIAQLQTKTVGADANNRLVQRENKSFTLAEGNIADLPNGTGLVKPYARKFKCRYDERDGRSYDGSKNDFSITTRYDFI